MEVEQFLLITSSVGSFMSGQATITLPFRCNERINSIWLEEGGLSLAQHQHPLLFEQSNSVLSYGDDEGPLSI